MKRNKSTQVYLLLVAILGLVVIAGCPVAGTGEGPTVSFTVPVDSATDVFINTAITATFSEPMDALTVTTDTFTLKQGTTAVAGTVTYADGTATFVPAANLAASTAFTATITTGAQDVEGNALASPHVWSFTTGTSVDTTPPRVVATFPSDGDTGVGSNGTITAQFSKDMNPATIVGASFTVVAGLTSVAGTVTYDLPNKTAIFAPDGNLAFSTLHTVNVTTGAKDLIGNGLEVNKVWSFTTAAAGLGPEPVSLGTAGNYAILAKTAISTVPSSAITGDIGLSPAAESFMTGFSQTKATGYSTSPQVIGFMYAADMTPPTPSNMTTAISDMETAYTDAAGRSLSVVENLGAGTIGGLTFAPGLYRWGSSVNVTTSITINGATNDVWIFQISGDLIVSSAVNIILSGGAQAKNIFWQVAGYAQLGTTSHFEGTILCQTAITLQTGASMNGRALAQTQVALDQNALTEPAP